MPPRIDDPPLRPGGGAEDALDFDASAAAYLSHWIEDAHDRSDHDIHHEGGPAYPPLERQPYCRRRKTIGDLPRGLPPPPFGRDGGRGDPGPPPASPQCVLGGGAGVGRETAPRPPVSSSRRYARRHSDEGRPTPSGHGHGGHGHQGGNNFDDFASSFRSAFVASQRQHQSQQRAGSFHGSGHSAAPRRAVSFRARRRYTIGGDDVDGSSSGINRPKSKSEHGTRGTHRTRASASGNSTGVPLPPQGAGYPSAPAHRRHSIEDVIEASRNDGYMRRDSMQSHGTVSTGVTAATLSPDAGSSRSHRAKAVKSILKTSAAPPPVSRHYRPVRGHEGGSAAAGNFPEAAVASAGGERRPMILPDRTLGDTASPSDVLHPLPADPFRTLRVHDFVWLRRTDGSWTYAIFSDFRTVRGEGAMRFVTDFRGSTKTLRGRKLAKNLRLVDRRPAQAAPANGDGSVGTGSGSLPSDAAVTSLLNGLGNLDMENERGRAARNGRGDATCGTWTFTDSPNNVYV